MNIFVNTCFSTISFGSRILVNSVFLILLARGLDTVEFGRFSYALAFSNIILVINDFGFAWQVVRDIAKNNEKTSILVKDIVSAKILIAFIVFLILILYSYFIKNNINDLLLIYILSLSSVFFSFGQFYGVIFRGYNRFEIETKSTLFFNLVLLTTVFLLLYLTKNVILIAIAFLFSRILYLIYAKWLYYKSFGHISFSILDILRSLNTIKQGMPFGILVLGGMALINVDTLILNYFKGFHEVGIYQAGLRLIISLLILSEILISSYYPKITSQIIKIDSEESIVLITQLNKILIFIGLIFFTLLLIFPNSVVELSLGKKYNETIQILPYMGFVLLLRYVSGSYGAILLIKDKQKFRSFAVIIAVIINILLNIYFIPLWGIYGTILASIISHLIMVSLYIILTFIYFNSLLINNRIIYMIIVFLGGIGVLYCLKLSIGIQVLLYLIIILIGLIVALDRNEIIIMYNLTKRYTHLSKSFIKHMSISK